MKALISAFALLSFVAATAVPVVARAADTQTMTQPDAPKTVKKNKSKKPQRVAHNNKGKGTKHIAKNGKNTKHVAKNTKVKKKTPAPNEVPAPTG